MTGTFTRTPATAADSVDVSLIPTALPVLPVEERGCSCIYCFHAKETFIEPPARHTEYGVRSDR
ncbi:hypothetical protein [Streptomyces sp. NPDC001568]|uniref:hypothetical protein n=1 Tax=Streptomyces sp. NPDC001568 TaxID=3364588 RepID=UPI0036B47909